MINERLMQPGRWSFKFKPETPLRIRQEIDFRDHFVVTPTRLPAGVTYLTLVSSSIYTGVILERNRSGPNQGPSWGGLNLQYWLGDTQKGHLTLSSSGTVVDTFSNNITNLWAVAPGTFAAGMTLNLSSVPSTVFADDFNGGVYGIGETIMKQIDRWRRKTTPTTEFAVRHTAEVWFSGTGQGSTFVQTPRMIVAREVGESVIAESLRVAQASEIVDERDAYDEQSAATIWGSGFTSGGSATNTDWNPTGILKYAGVGMARYYDQANDVVYPGSGSADPYNFACQYRAESVIGVQRQNTKVKIPARAFTPNVDLRCGDYFYLWDPWTDMTDTANKVYLGPSEVHPKKVRANSLSWDPWPGMGVYWLKTNQMSADADMSTPKLVEDVTDYIEMGERVIEIDVDSKSPFRGYVTRDDYLS